MTDETLLQALSDSLRLALSDFDQRRIHEIGARGEVSKLRNALIREPNQNLKLVMLAGIDALRRELPLGADKLAESRRGRKLTDEEVAAMARASKGASLLSRLAPAIEEKGLVLPKLSGGAQARSAIQDLGLAPEFAGSRGASPAPRFEVIGPVALPELHPYQEDVVERLLKVLRPGGLNRGIVSLPTGSGKTRVAVEAIIRFVQESLSDPLVIWIAQSDELCEQAVETWSYAWSAIAPPGEKLTISRLWGANDTTPADESAHLVVATDAKLLSLSRKRNHEWLTDAVVVLVDEAHTSVSKTYTELFRWLKRGTRERDRVLIGLNRPGFDAHPSSWKVGHHAIEVRRGDQGQGGPSG
ncbi:DEAD/DEAH box helicase, partial [Antrihabitans sp. NCIMB 15449]